MPDNEPSVNSEKPHLGLNHGRWTVLVEPYVYRTQTFAQACEVARRIVGPDRHLPAFLWLRTPPMVNRRTTHTHLLSRREPGADVVRQAGGIPLPAQGHVRPGAGDDVHDASRRQAVPDNGASVNSEDQS